MQPATAISLGTARINPASKDGRKYFIVRWMNTGSFLQNEPRGFWTETEALDFCREHGLRVVSS